MFFENEDPSPGSSSIISGGLKNLGPHQAPQRHRQVSFDSFAIGFESRRFRWSSQTTIAFSPQSKRILVTELYPVTPLRQLLWRLADVLIADTQWRANTNEEYAVLLSERSGATKRETWIWSLGEIVAIALLTRWKWNVERSGVLRGVLRGVHRVQSTTSWSVLWYVVWRMCACDQRH